MQWQRRRFLWLGHLFQAVSRTLHSSQAPSACASTSGPSLFRELTSLRSTGRTKNVVDEAVENASKAVCSAGAAAVSAGEQAGKALADGVAAVGGVVGKGAQAAGGVLEEGAKVAGGALEGGLRVAGKGLGDAAKGIGGFFGSIGKK